MTKGSERESQAKAQDGGEEGTEFWPPLYGYRLKVTDTIIAGFTVSLSIATFLLWLSTRALAKGADDTAKRQLRAYVGIESGHVVCETASGVIRARPVLRVKNVGQTPAYRMTSSVAIAVAQRFSDETDATKTIIKGNTYIFPGGSHRILGVGKNLELTDEANTEIFVFGVIEYYDIFSAKKMTRFRFFVRNFSPSDRKGELAPCDDGNDAT